MWLAPNGLWARVQGLLKNLGWLPKFFTHTDHPSSQVSWNLGEQPKILKFTPENSAGSWVQKLGRPPKIVNSTQV